MKSKLLLLTKLSIFSYLFYLLEKINNSFSLVGEGPFFSKELFPWVFNIEESTNVIQQELDKILLFENIPNFQDISVEQLKLTNDNRWKTFFFYGYGYKCEENCIKCPKTAAILEKIPNLKTAFFSILFAQKHIPLHRGPYNGVLRYHLALRIPSESNRCAIKVGDEIRHWKEASSLIFDDTYPHQAWNKTDSIRVILFVDFVRPLPWFISKVNNWFIDFLSKSTFVTDAEKNLKSWNLQNSAENKS